MTDLATDTISVIAQAFTRDPKGPTEQVFLDTGFDVTLSTLRKLFRDTNDATLWAVAVLLVAIERGGTCLPLAEIAHAPGAEKIPEALRSFTVAEWETVLTGEAFGAVGGEPKPLLIAHGRLYFDRYFQLESAVAEQLLGQLDSSIPDATLKRPSNWSQICDEVFTSSDGLSRHVAEQFFDSRCYLLAGGPGTGKTYTIAKLLAALTKAGTPLSDIALCAPTGKAANRMRSAITSALEAARVDGATIEGISTSTIHTLLSITPQTFKRKSVTPLTTKLVICDETSMVDLALLHELLSALPQSSRIILVGDPNQLQSVDVGSAMLDLIRAHEEGVLPGTVLEVVHRVDAAMDATARTELLEFFHEIRTATSADRAISMLRRGMTAVTYVPFSTEVDAEAQIANALGEAVARAENLKAAAITNADRRTIEATLTSTMVLTAQHEGDLSRTWWVERIARKANLSARRIDKPGLPLLVTQTDRPNHLTNGDSGLLVERDSGIAMMVAEAEPPRYVSATALHHVQPWWAMTIHKSQGSEFDTVTVAITPSSRLISKELLYTAVTRAKKHVTIIATEDDLRTAIERPARRFTGLFEALVTHWNNRRSAA